MAALIVRAEAASAAWGERAFACRVGRCGTCAAGAKREGDGRSPLGAWPVRSVLLRPDRGIAPPRLLPWRWLREADGWCDDPSDPAYNRAVRHPYPASAERLWRDDATYDAIVTLGHNDAPPVAGAGSAIFLHLAADRPTAGCVAVDRDAMGVLLRTMAPGDIVAIEP